MWKWWACSGDEQLQPIDLPRGPRRCLLRHGRRRRSFPQHILRYRNQRAAATVGLDGLTRRGVGRRISAASCRCPASFEQPLALRYHGHQFQTYNPGPRRRARLPVRAAARRARAAARSRHQGLGADAVVAHGRRAADAEGRRARGAGDLDARGAGRRYQQIAEPDRDRRGAGAPRRAVADARRACWCG